MGPAQLAFLCTKNFACSLAGFAALQIHKLSPALPEPNPKKENAAVINPDPNPL